jgi:hypothetical protein
VHPPGIRLAAHSGADRAARQGTTVDQEFSQGTAQSNVIALMDIVRYAPTGMNTQTVSWKVILDEQEIQFLSLAVIEWLRTLEGEQVHGVKGMLKAWERGRDPILRKAPADNCHGAVDDPMVSLLQLPCNP